MHKRYFKMAHIPTFYIVMIVSGSCSMYRWILYVKCSHSSLYWISVGGWRVKWTCAHTRAKYLWISCTDWESIRICLRFCPLFDYWDDDYGYYHGTDHVRYQEHVKVMSIKLRDGDMDASVAFDQDVKDPFVSVRDLGYLQIEFVCGVWTGRV